MSEGGIQRRRSQAQWRALVSAFEAGDQSLRLFCAEQDVAVVSVWRTTSFAWPARAGMIAPWFAIPGAGCVGKRGVAGDVTRDEVLAG